MTAEEVQEITRAGEKETANTAMIWDDEENETAKQQQSGEKKAQNEPQILEKVTEEFWKSSMKCTKWKKSLPMNLFLANEMSQGLEELLHHYNDKYKGINERKHVIHKLFSRFS